MVSPLPIFPFNDQTWIVSDTHFFHANIGLYCNRPDGWQETIIENWNRLVGPDEVIFHLGDLAFGKREALVSLVSLLNGRLYLMRGNHDRRSCSFYQRQGITLVPDPYHLTLPSGIKLVFSHRPILPLDPGVTNLHGHIHNNSAPAFGTRHINLSVEMRDYRPWRLGELLTTYITPPASSVTGG